MEFRYFNPSPSKRNVGDCTVRALSKATGQDWERTYAGLALEGFIRRDMPSSNAVWGSYLRHHGYHRELAPDDMTVEEFADLHPEGTYVLALSGHVVCIQDGVLYDTWNSGSEIVLYFWKE